MERLSHDKWALQHATTELREDREVWARAQGYFNQSRCWERGCDEALFSGKTGFSVKRGEEIQ